MYQYMGVLLGLTLIKNVYLGYFMFVLLPFLNFIDNDFCCIHLRIIVSRW